MRMIKKRKNRAFVAAICALVTCIAFGGTWNASAASPFGDVDANYWAYDDIVAAYESGAVGGVGYDSGGQRLYDPAGNVTMAQFIAMLTRAFYPESVEMSSEDEFWYSPNYDVALTAGLFRDLPDNDPDTAVTREMMAQIMYNLLAQVSIWGGTNIQIPTSQEIQSAKNAIPDINAVNAQMRDSVAVCYSFHLITGVDSAGNFSPKGLMNRAQTAVIYNRLQDAVENGVKPNAAGTAQNEPASSNANAVLTNGMSVTEENVLALMREYENGKAPGAKAQAAGFTSYQHRAKYDAYNPSYYSSVLRYNGTECAKFAYAFWDDLFGDLPAREITNPEDVRPGDLIYLPGHWAIATTSAFKSGNNIYAMAVSGGSAGEIGWGNVNNVIGNGRLVEAYTRYP